MVPLSQLQFARKYPFSSYGKNAVKQLAPQLETISPEVFDRASELISAAVVMNSKQRRAFVESHFGQRELSYEEFLSHDVLAFPIAKILISFSKNPIWFDKFAALMGDITFEYLVNEKEKLSNLMDLAQDMKLRIDLRHDVQQTRISIPLTQFIAVPLQDAQLHLVNQRVDHGMVVLETNAACRWLAEAVYASILFSLPVEVKGLPSLFQEKFLQLQKRIREKQLETAKASAMGVMNLQAFPPCMDKLYSELNSGVNLPHMARFDLATFLVNIQMPQEDIVSLFAKAPNYDERITRYHVDNISGKHSGKKYSAPSCAKVREHSLCISRTCNVMHPMQFYERESNPSTARKEKKGGAIPNESQNPAGSTIVQ